jgi:hypothetical protein
MLLEVKMRKVHLDYIKDLVSQVHLDGAYPFIPAVTTQEGGEEFYDTDSKFFEITPSIDHFQELVPFCLVQQGRDRNYEDNKLSHRLEDIKPTPETKTKQYLKRHYIQEIPVTLEFWLDDPSSELLSESNDRGIIDQVLIYISNFKKVPNEHGVTMSVTTKSSGVITDPSRDISLYKVFVEIVFTDGLYTKQEIATMAGSHLELASSEIKEKESEN